MLGGISVVRGILTVSIKERIIDGAKSKGKILDHIIKKFLLLDIPL